MINGTTGVYADRDGVVEHIPLATPYTNERLQAAIERVARILGPRPHDPESDPQYALAGRLRVSPSSALHLPSMGRPSPSANSTAGIPPMS